MGANGGHIAYVLTLSFLSISIIILVIFLIFLCRRKQVASEVTSHDHDVKTSLKNFPFSEITSITDWFNPRKAIGKGQLGTTYVAELAKNDLVAVKRIHPWLVLSNPGVGFQSMIRSLSQANNPHIVPIIGFSEAPGERVIIVKALASTMSLDFYLHHNVDGPTLLDWSKRTQIATGVARGLEYLHEKMAPQVVHGCVKPSNILVDASFCAQLCDYGLSFLSSKHGKIELDGYVDEEGISCCCKESDVYGFGVVLLELLSGRRNEHGLLLRWVLPLIKGMRFSEFLDPRLAMPSNLKPIIKLSQVALACVGNSRKTRPTISQIVSILDNLDTNI